MLESPYTQNVLSLFYKGVEMVKGIGIRMGIHILAIVGAITIAKNTPSWESFLGDTSIGLSFGIYLGLVCLFPRTKGALAQWLTATSAGVTQALLLTFFGIPWQLTILWAGVQTWVLRCIFNKMAMGWEWLALFWLFITTVKNVQVAGSVLPYGWILLTVPLVTLLALVAYYVYCKIVIGPKHFAQIQAFISQVQKKLVTNMWPDQLAESLQQLLNQSSLAIKALPVPNQATELLFGQVIPLEHQLELVEKKMLSLTIGNAKAPSPYLINNDPQTVRLFSHVTVVSNALTSILEKHTLPASANEEESKVTPNSRYLMFQNFSRELAKRKAELPSHLHSHIDGLRIATQSIIEGMQRSEQEYSRGEHFLVKFLPMALKIIDNYIRFSRDGGSKKDSIDILARLEAVFIRLENTFISEYSNQLSNDAMELKAEIATLDTLLRIEGK